MEIRACDSIFASLLIPSDKVCFWCGPPGRCKRAHQPQIGLAESPHTGWHGWHPARCEPDGRSVSRPCIMTRGVLDWRCHFSGWASLLPPSMNRKSLESLADAAFDHQDIRPRLPAALAFVFNHGVRCLPFNEQRVAIFADSVLHRRRLSHLCLQGDSSHFCEQATRGSLSELGG